MCGRQSSCWYPLKGGVTSVIVLAEAAGVVECDVTVVPVTQAGGRRCTMSYCYNVCVCLDPRNL